MRVFLLIVLILVILPSKVFADARSDFDYQYSKYREHFLEFSLYKKDYLETPSLDNQQKTLLTAKLALNSRDLTKASFAYYVRDLVLQNNLSYAPLSQINDGLVEAGQYFLSEAAKSQKLVTLADVESFDKSYHDTYQKHEKSVKVGIVAQKLAKLKYFSLMQEKSLKSLKSRLPNNISVRVTERINTLEQSLQYSNQKIDTMANYLISEEGMDNVDSEIFFSSKIELLSDIRSLQLEWMDQLIDLDLNYGKI